MSRRAPEAGIVAVGVAPVRRRPSHGAELVSQALLGETFRVAGSAAAGEWLRVRLDADGYEGWLRSWYAVAGGERDAALWAGRARARVARREVAVRERPTAASPAIAVLPWQARLAPLAGGRGQGAGRWIAVRLPDGVRGHVPRAALAAGPAPGGPPSPARLARTAARLLGTPYLWGGRSSWGFDCSGFVQAVLAWHGVTLPRDARDQFAALAAAASPPPGAAGTAAPRLLFFGRSRRQVSHVALATGGEGFVHAFGRVQPGSLETDSQNYVPQLIGAYLGAFPLALSSPVRRTSP